MCLMMNSIKTRWFEKAIGYEIYPYSFFDSNDDGYGDLRGIISKLDYLKELGISLIWLCPIYASPLDDYGYDVEDYYRVNPLLGNNDDLKKLLREAHSRDIRVILDLVMNHVSCQHQWFKEALKSRDSKYHDYFIFKDPLIKNGRKCPPNNWMGFFSESVWSYAESLDQYYFHTFSSKMPDLNWDNPEARKEMFRIAEHYLDLGVDGFRLDALAHLAKDASYLDSDHSKDPVLDTGKFSNRKEVFEYLREFKEEVLDRYDCLTVGEVGGEASTQLALEYTKYIDMVFNFDTCWENGAYGSVSKGDEEIRLDLINLKSLFKKWFDSCHGQCDMPLYWLNHDHPRLLSQYGSLEYRNESAKMLAGVLLFMYGLPFIYQGEEIGMSNVTYDRLEDFYEDVSSRNFVASSNCDEEVLLRFLRRCSRISARSPIQWNDKKHAGFSKRKPYIKVNDNYPEINVERNLREEDSIFRFYQKLISLRKRHNDLVYKGSFELIDPENEHLFIYHKEYQGEEIIVIANFSDKGLKHQVDESYELLISNYPAESERGCIKAYGLYVFRKSGNNN